MKKCTKCKQEKLFDEFNFKSKKLGTRHGQCKSCTRLLVKNHYDNNQEYYLRKTQKRNRKLRIEVLKYQQEYLLKNSCVDCGESDIAVLEFDHNGEIPKFKAVSLLIRARCSLAKIQVEVKKCEVRCANCHRRKTVRDFKWFKSKDALVA